MRVVGRLARPASVGCSEAYRERAELGGEQGLSNVHLTAGKQELAATFSPVSVMRAFCSIGADREQTTAAFPAGAAQPTAIVDLPHQQRPGRGSRLGSVAGDRKIADLIARTGLPFHPSIIL